MNQFELYDRKPRNESSQPRYRTNQPKAWGSMNEGTQQRIVMLYTDGQSIESITKEVGRARHLVVHVLQSKGVFGNRRTEPDHEESRTESPVVAELNEELVNEEREPETSAVKGSEPERVVEESPRKTKPLRASKSPGKLKVHARCENETEAVRRRKTSGHQPMVSTGAGCVMQRCRAARHESRYKLGRCPINGFYVGVLAWIPTRRRNPG